MIGALNGTRAPVIVLRGRAYRDYSTTIGRYHCRCLVDRDLEDQVATSHATLTAEQQDQVVPRWAPALERWLASGGGTRQWD